jgi:hypothetical protein
MFTVIWLTVFTVGLTVHILEGYRFHFVSQALFIALLLFVISSYTSSIMAVVCISIVKRRRFLKIIEIISEVDNKLRYTQQEVTHVNRNVRFNIISDIILLSVLPCTVIIVNLYQLRIEKYYIFNSTLIIMCVTYIGNLLIVLHFLNLVLMVKQWNSHLNNRLTNWIKGTVSSPIILKKQNVRNIRHDRAGDHLNITPLYVSSVGNIEGKLKHTDIQLLRQIYSELYDIYVL